MFSFFSFIMACINYFANPLLNRQMSPETTKETFEMGVDLLRLRSLILRILGAAILLSENAPAVGKMPKVDVTNGSESSNEGDLTSVLQRLINELDQHFGSLCSRYPVDVHMKKVCLFNLIEL